MSTPSAREAAQRGLELVVVRQLRAGRRAGRRQEDSRRRTKPGRRRSDSLPTGFFNCPIRTVRHQIDTVVKANCPVATSPAQQHSSTAPDITIVIRQTDRSDATAMTVGATIMQNDLHRGGKKHV